MGVWVPTRCAAQLAYPPPSTALAPRLVPPCGSRQIPPGRPFVPPLRTRLPAAEAAARSGRPRGDPGRQGPVGRGRSPPRSRWFLGSRPADQRGGQVSSIPAGASRSSGSGTAAGVARPRSAAALAGKMQPVSRAVPASPLQEANLCSRAFLRCAPRLSCNVPPLGAQCLTPPAPLAGRGRLFAVGGASPRRPLGLRLRPGTLGGREQGRGGGPGDLVAGAPVSLLCRPASLQRPGAGRAGGGEVENRGCPRGVTSQWENGLDPRTPPLSRFLSTAQEFAVLN